MNEFLRVLRIGGGALADNQAIQAKIREVSERFPWYSPLLVDPQNPPLLTADILEKHYYIQAPESNLPLSVYSTSGTSSGRRKSIYYSEQDDEKYIEIKTQLFKDWIATAPIRKVLVDMGTGHAASTALNVFQRIGLIGESLSFALPIECHLERLDAFKPDLLYTMPSLLDHLARAAGNPERFGIQKIILVGEIASPAWQRQMSNLFGIEESDILDTYGSIEIGTIAHYSHEHGKYIVVDGLLAEGIGAEEVGETFEPLADNECVLVLTSLSRDWFPAVRYVTYDVVRDFGTVEWKGMTKQAFGSIVKRIGPELKHGEKISLYDIEEVVCRFLENAEMRVIVQDRVLSVQLKSSVLDESILPSIRSAIERKIPEIGIMIQNRILAEVEVKAVADNEWVERDKVKTKKIYYGKA